MNKKQGGLIFFIVVVLAILLFNLNYLGFSVANTSSSVIIHGANSPPIISNLNETMFICEDEKLYAEFNVSDPNSDTITSYDLNPTDPFYLFWIRQDAPYTVFAIVSGELNKGDTGGLDTGFKLYEETISVSDGFETTTADTNITVIEINHAPTIEDVGVQTVYTSGENSTFYEEVDSTDEEYDAGHGDLNFNISITNSTGHSVNLFNISSEGIMDFTATNQTPIGVYNITICVNDTGLTTPFVNISQECNQSGGTLSACDNFSLTVTNSNRAPNITAYYPIDLNFSVGSTTPINFNITKYDPDGTIPDAYWYLDGELQEYDSGSSIDYFTYTFGCGVASGVHNFTVNITDGLLNDSIMWNVTINSVACVVPSPGGGGGGGGGGALISKFEVEPDFITTTILQEEGKSFDIKLKNTGNTQLNLDLQTVNISDISILSDEALVIGVGEEKTTRVYFYALSKTKPGVYFGKILISEGSTQKTIHVVVEVKKKEALFDIAVNIPTEYKNVLAGEKMSVFVDMLNIGLYGTAVDAELFLYIMDFDKLILYEASKETLAVETNLSIVRELYVPEETKKGTYLVFGKVKYNNITISTYDTFNVLEKKYVKASYFIVLVIVVALILLIFFLIWKRRKDRKERGYK